MKLPGLWSRSDFATEPFKAFRKEMEDWFSQIDKNLPSVSLGAGVPAVNVAETDKAIEITAELPCVEDKDIKVNVEGNQLIVSGEKKQESKRDDKDCMSKNAASALSTSQCLCRSRRRMGPSRLISIKASSTLS
jgi:HSP20 family protein